MFLAESEKVGNTSINIFALVAFEVAYGDVDSEDWFNQLNDYINHNQEYAYDFVVRNLPKIKVLKADATYFLWLDLEQYANKIDNVLEFMLDEANVYVTPGDFFGEQYKNYIRLNLACPLSTVIRALNNIKNALDKL